jgi:hypothetical protein
MIQLALALGADNQQPDRESRVAAVEQDVGPWATWSRFGANRPTASAPAVAPSAVRHHASQVRSTAIEVRRA